MYSIAFCTQEDTLAVRELWDIAFPEEPVFNDWFFANEYRDEYCLALKQDGKILTMAQLLPYYIEGVGKVSYVYGAATHPDYRKRGLMRELLKRSEELDKSVGRVASVLIPANEGLFDFYSRLGYQTAFYVRKGELLKPVNTDGYTVRKADEKDIAAMNELYVREVKLNGSFVVRQYDYWLRQLKMFASLGGEVCILEHNGTCEGYAFITDGMAQEVFGNTAVLLSLTGVKKYITYSAEGANTPIGMLLPYDNNMPDRMYMNMMFN